MFVERLPDRVKKWIIDPAWVGYSQENDEGNSRLTNVMGKKLAIPCVPKDGLWRYSRWDGHPGVIL